jgi:hypothetical protein
VSPSTPRAENDLDPTDPSAPTAVGDLDVADLDTDPLDAVLAEEDAVDGLPDEELEVDLDDLHENLAGDDLDEDLDDEELDDELEDEALDEADEDADDDEDEDLDAADDVEEGTAPLALDPAFEDEDEDLAVVVVGDDEDDEDVDGLRDGEFVCRSCFLAKRETQLADPERMLCRDCA